MKNLECVSLPPLRNLHPGIWFKDIWPSLDVLEKQAWLTLFTLAYISEGKEPINYISDLQLSDLFGIDEDAFRSAVKRATELGRITVLENVIVPCTPISQVPDSGDLKQSWKTGLRVLPNNTRPWARYKTMTFLAYSESKDHTLTENGKGEQVLLDQEGHTYRTHPLDEELIDPYGRISDLLRIADIRGPKRMITSTYKRQSLFFTVETRTLDVPDVYLFYDDTAGELNQQRVRELVPGIAIWDENHRELFGKIYQIWDHLEFEFVQYVGREYTYRKALENFGPEALLSQGVPNESTSNLSKLTDSFPE